MIEGKDKKLFIEVGVDVISFKDDDVLTASQPVGAYGQFDDWKGVDDVW